jgi:hypothetical protein
MPFVFPFPPMSCTSALSTAAHTCCSFLIPRCRSMFTVSPVLQVCVQWKLGTVHVCFPPFLLMFSSLPNISPRVNFFMPPEDAWMCRQRVLPGMKKWGIHNDFSMVNSCYGSGGNAKAHNGSTLLSFLADFYLAACRRTSPAGTYDHRVQHIC